MTGASRLAARGAARIGCGLICLGVPRKAFNIYATENPIALIEEEDDIDPTLDVGVEIKPNDSEDKEDI